MLGSAEAENRGCIDGQHDVVRRVEGIAIAFAIGLEETYTWTSRPDCSFLYHLPELPRKHTEEVEFVKNFGYEGRWIWWCVVYKESMAGDREA